MTILERSAPAGAGPDAESPDGPQDPTPWGLASPMRVRKRDGALEPIDLNKIVRAIGRASVNPDGTALVGVDPMRVATRTISGLHDGATTMELDELSIRTAAALVSEEPSYSRLAGRLLGTFIQKEVFNQNIHSFSQSIDAGHAAGLINDETATLVSKHSYKLNEAIEHERDQHFEYFGLRTVYDRYLLRDPEGRLVIETPQYFFMRVACGLSTTADEAIEFYRIISSLDYMPATPTLFNSGTTHPQMSSCYLVSSPEDTLESIYDRYKDVARLSKFAGGIGLAFHNVRSRGSLIRGTNGLSNGIVPWLKTLDSSVCAVNQCFAPDTVVFTAEGPTAIRDVKVGDVVLGISGVYREVTEKFTYNQTDPMVSVDVKHAIEPVHVTAGHPFYAVQGLPLEQTVERSMRHLESGRVRAEWIEAGDLRRGDFVAQPIPKEVVDPQITVDDARMLGIMLGDGHIRSNGYEHGVTWSPASDTETAEFVRSYLTERGVHFWETEMHGGSARQVRWSAGISLLRDGTTGQFVSGGMSALPFGRADIYTADGHKTIPRRFAHMPRPHTLAMLHGLIATDGNVSRGAEITFTSSSRQLAEGVRYQMLRLGVPTSGQRRVGHNVRGGVRADGSKVELARPSDGFDVRIPAVAELAELVGAKPLTEHNWLTWQGCVWSRVRNIADAPVAPFVFDLVVEGDESYTVAGALVHNGGKRKGAACVYLETWHADIEEFLELKENTGDEARRTHNLNLANWVPDLFMKRVENDWTWSLFDPKKVPHLTDLFGDEFERAYIEAESQKLFERQIPARQLYSRMMRTLAQTGNGWMTFKDPSNARCNQTSDPATDGRVSDGETPRVVHLSNLCTEILEVTSSAETAVCNLGSLNLGHFVATTGDVGEGAGTLAFDFARLGEVTRTAVRYLDRVVDINYYPTDEAAASNARWRPVGLGVMGLQDVFFKLRLPFDSPEARDLSKRIQEEIYFNALWSSTELAEANGTHPAYADTRAADGKLQFDLWGVAPTDPARWEPLRARVAEHGLRNSLLIAIAPTATIASICGAYECIEPQVSNLFKRETLSGEFLQINTYLVRELQSRGLWTDETRDAIKRAEGSVQGVDSIPDDVKALYRTAWELPMRSLIDMAAERGAFIDQSQSLNLFMESPTIGKLSSMYLHAWKQGLKTTYYLRSRPATRIAQTTTSGGGGAAPPPPPSSPVSEMTAKTFSDEEAVACSLADPESCEACQ